MVTRSRIREGIPVAHDKAHHQCDGHRRDEGIHKNDGDNQGNGNRAPEKCDTGTGNDADEADRERNKGKEPEYQDPDRTPDKEAREDVSPRKPGGKGEGHEDDLYHDKGEEQEEAHLEVVINEDLGIARSP